MGSFNKGSGFRSQVASPTVWFTLLHLKKRGGGFTFNAWLVTLTSKHNIQLLYSLIAVPLLTECQILCPAHSPKLNHVPFPAPCPLESFQPSLSSSLTYWAGPGGWCTSAAFQTRPSSASCPGTAPGSWLSVQVCRGKIHILLLN